MQINTSIESLSIVDCKIKRMNEAFTGIFHNRYLKRLNISSNQFEEGIKELCDLVKTNKVLNEIRIRFCGLKAENFVSFFEAMTHNASVNYLDIS